MQTVGRLFRQNWKVSSLFLLLAVLYITQTLTSKPSRYVLEHYHVTAHQLHQISLTVAIPYILIWTIGLVGYLRLATYTRLLKTGKDRAGFRLLTRGVFLFVLWLPISTIFTNISSAYYTNHSSSTATLIRLINYVNVVFLFIAFFWLLRGSEKLVALTKVKRWGLTQRQTLLYIAFAAFYVFVTFSDPVRQTTLNAMSQAT